MTGSWPLEYFPARVLRVIDGDTFEADFDLGMKVHAQLPCRLAGVNAPELRKGTDLDRARAVAALDFMKANLPPGMAVNVKSHQFEKYGRVLGTVFVGAIGSRSINDQIIDAGLADRVL